MTAVPSTEEYEALQRASDKYEPEIIGPLVAEREPSALIAEEYAKADPIYRVKTAAMKDTHESYRRCRGDGNCGWRAMAFGYFESLIQLNKPEKCASELARFESLGNLLNAAGFEGVYEDFATCTTELLQLFADPQPGQNNADVLLTNFNDEQTSGSIIYHFRLLASAWMRANPDEFMPYLDVPVEAYCKSQIEIPTVELDQPGIRALVDVVYKDAGFGLEIVYLDRSAGSEANIITHSQPYVHIEGATALDYPMVSLLYRPGHYDIIYKSS